MDKRVNSKRKCYRPHYLRNQNRWVIGAGGNQSLAIVRAEVNRRNAAIEKKGK